MFVPAQAIIAKWLESFKEFPPRAKAASTATLSYHRQPIKVMPCYVPF
jgi:hypothetical protein